ncbi:endonuclease domain-containing protein [uncultured Microbacterium sp.]|uniref:endonuclease domain-containing protein n=1 Tax=uncultured Microbacterium sp. TaxID=191216 RepID=UPI0035C9C25C
MTTVSRTEQASAERRRAADRALIAAVEQREGVARLSHLHDQGHSRHTVALALARGALVRIRRDWVSLPGADAELVAAARSGVVLSCVTLARRMGLWVLDDDRCHVAADPHGAAGKSERATVHWSAPMVPRHPDQLLDSLTNALVLIAYCRPREAALAVWESALSKGMIDLAQMSRLPLTGAAARMLAEMRPYRDSGLETIFVDRLRWLRVRMLVQTWIAGHRVDVLIGDRLAVQLDGGHHVGDQRTSDIAHDAALMLLGYHVLRFGYQQVIDDWPLVQETIMQAVAQGLHLVRK